MKDIFQILKIQYVITLEKLAEKYPNNKFTLALTGSGAMSAAKFLGVDFIQEVVSCKRAVEKYIPTNRCSY